MVMKMRMNTMMTMMMGKMMMMNAMMMMNTMMMINTVMMGKMVCSTSVKIRLVHTDWEINLNALRYLFV